MKLIIYPDISNNDISGSFYFYLSSSVHSANSAKDSAKAILQRRNLCMVFPHSYQQVYINIVEKAVDKSCKGFAFAEL